MHLLALLRVDTRAAELISAAILGSVWGAWLLLPLHTFASSATYRPMATIGNELGWGLTLLLIALVQSAALLFHWQRWRFIGALLSAAAYAFIAVMFGLGNPPGVGLPTYGILALANLWAIRRLSR